MDGARAACSERLERNDQGADDAEQVLTALARQIGLVLHDVRLGSPLEASHDELQRQADELRASRARVVAAADAERRRIERFCTTAQAEADVLALVELDALDALAHPGQGAVGEVMRSA
jgi:hypothetical protein